MTRYFLKFQKPEYMNNRVYKSEFEYKGFVIQVEGKYYSGRIQTYLEPEEQSGFDILKIKADGNDIDPDEFFHHKDYKDSVEFENMINDKLYEANEHLIFGYDPDL
jgi:hypothetical protein